ncbi:YcaO-like family protein [Rhizobium ruizarguesonis]|uniref:YcaO-like family protein n=1 Tax=Rhizobium ruizarguesonis TaxID=2081791 RepID=UPI0010310063|nr:YcaO-like family protein [Rhizobium ruizarguesonis]TBD34874.1 hypothetical protein ELH17_33510 [Rhizobium ruizarguesonis]TBD54522.1 hypothetical protein ELH16_31670 [Rhizobium ruizarguesonis]TBF00459.1 hypothetical protein ELG96_34615 [Rhizobium ruizarguesonis]
MVPSPIAHVRRSLARIGDLGLTLIEEMSPTWLRSVKVVKILSSRRFNEWGRGLDLADASIGGVMERVERVSAHLAQQHVPVVWLAPERAELPVVGLSQLGLCNFQAYLNWDEQEANVENAFVQMSRFGDDANVLAPASRVFLSNSVGRLDFSCSTGLAAHFSREEAIERAILECLERHFHHVAMFGQKMLPQEIDLSGITSRRLRQAIDELLDTGFKIRVLRFELLSPLHSVVVSLEHRSDGDDLKKHSKFHCAVSWELEHGIERAITEMIVGRCAANWHPSPMSAPSMHPIPPIFSDPIHPAVMPSEFSAIDPLARREALASIGNRLGSDFLLCDLTNPEIQLPVYRALAPGLQPNFDLLGFDPSDFRARVTPHLSIYSDVRETVLSGSFHQQSVYLNMSGNFGAKSSLDRSSLPSVFLRYDGDATKLSETSPSIVEALIEARASSREIGASVEFDDFSRILRRGVGGRSMQLDPVWGFYAKRTYPSGGARHSLEIFAEINAVVGMEPGIYHYSIPDAAVVRVSASPEDAWTNRTVTLPAVVFYIISCASRVDIKYPMYANRFAQLEAGHLAQNVLLICESLSIHAVPLGASLRTRLWNCVRLPTDGRFVYALAVGGKAKSAVGREPE